MSVSATAALSATAVRVHDDLNLESLPRANRDPYRKVVWANAVCGSVLVVGLALTKSPAQFMFQREEVDAAPVEVPVIAPEQQLPQTPPSKDEPPDTSEPDAPVVSTPTVVVANTQNITFAVAVSGPTVTSSDFKHVPPPPRVTPKVKPPSGPVEFRGGGPSADGGYYPKVEYPRDALLRHEQGEVRLYVAVAEDGSIEKIQVNASSGSSGLDRSALQGVKRTWRWPAGPHREFIVPIEFRLE